MFKGFKQRYATALALRFAILVSAAVMSGCGAGHKEPSPSAGIPSVGATPAFANNTTLNPNANVPSGPFPIPAPGQMYARLHGTRLVFSSKHSAQTVTSNSQTPVKSASSIVTHTGDEFEDSLSQRALPIGSEAAFDSAWVDGTSMFDTVSYATYRFNLKARIGRLTIRTGWTKPPGTPPLDYSRIWLGASNWQSNRWDWYSGAASGAALTKDGSIDLYRHPLTDEMLVVVVQLAKTPILLNRVWLSGYSLRGDWWMYGRNATHSADAPFNGPDYPTVLWKQQIGTGINLQQPAYDADGNLYFGTGESGTTSRNLICYSQAGVPLWTQPLFPLDEADPGWPSPALGYDGGVYYALHHGPLYVMYMDGTLGWVFNGHKCVDGNPALGPDGTAYVIGAAGDTYAESYLHAIDSHGIQAWEYSFGEYAVSSPVVGPDGTIFVGCADMNLYAFQPDGAIKWTYLADEAVVAGLSTSSDGNVYFEDANAKLYAVDADGALGWSYQLPGSAASGLTGMAIGADGAIYIPATDERLYALNADGTLRWIHQIGPCLAAPAIDAKGIVYVTSMDCRLYALNADGTLRWWFVADAPLRTQPVIAENGTLYVCDMNGAMYALGPGNQQLSHTISGFVKDETATGLAGVTITISGSEPVVTDATGFWSKSGLRDGDYLISPTLDGYAFSPLFDIATVSGGDVVVADFTGSLQNTPIWPQWGLDRAHTRRATHNGRADVAAKWITQFDGEGIISQPVIGGDGVIYIQFTNGILRALNPDGSLRWQYYEWSASNAAPALGADGTVFSSTVDGLVFALTPGGAYKWSRYIEDGLSGSPVVAADGAILHNRSSSGIIALNPDGTDKWQYSAGSGFGCEATPAIADDGTVYCGNGVDLIYALNDDGTEKWVFTADPGAVTEPSQTSPAVGADGTVYMGFGKNFYALNPDGTQQWVYPVGAKLVSSPAVSTDGSLVFGTGIDIALEGARMLALNPDGTLKWQYPTHEEILSSPAIDGSGAVYAGVRVEEETMSGIITSLSANGAPQWSVGAPGLILASPVIGDDGTVYFCNNEGIIYAIGPGT